MTKTLLTVLALLSTALSNVALAQTPPPPTVEYYHLDAIGSVRAVTNESGQVVRRHDYFPFGEEYLAQGGNDSRRFTGKERDTETGLDYFVARYYAQRTGRLASADPVTNTIAALVDPQLWNRFAYSRSNPLRYVDPNGLLVRVRDDLALALILDTLPEELRESVRLGRDGFIDAQALRGIKTTNKNFLALRELVNSREIIDVSTDSRAMALTLGALQEAPFSYDSGAGLAKYGLKPEPSSFLGIALPPKGSANPYAKDVFSLSASFSVTLANIRGVPKWLMRVTTAHELYGHALLYVRGQPFVHNESGVNPFILDAERRSK